MQPYVSAGHPSLGTLGMSPKRDVPLIPFYVDIVNTNVQLKKITNYLDEGIRIPLLLTGTISALSIQAIIVNWAISAAATGCIIMRYLS